MSLTAQFRELIERYMAARRKYACVMLPVHGAIEELCKRAAGEIDPADLAEDGIETDCHVTVKYGLHDDNPEPVRKILRDVGPITIQMTGLSLFENEDADVLKIDVDGKELRKLNATISSECECTDAHSEYKPHVTIAYLQPGKGQQYLETIGYPRTMPIFTGDEILFSSSTKEHTTIPLEDQPERLRREFSRLIERYSKDFEEGQVKRDTLGRFASQAMASSPKWFQKAYPAVKKSLSKALSQGEHSAAMTREELADAFDAAGHGTAKQALPFLRQLENDGTLRKFKVAGETRYALADRPVAPDEADESEQVEATPTHPFDSTQSRKPAGELPDQHKGTANEVRQSLDREAPLDDVLKDFQTYDDTGKPTAEGKNKVLDTIAVMIRQGMIEYQKRPGVNGSVLRRTDLEPHEGSDWEGHTGKYRRIVEEQMERYRERYFNESDHPRDVLGRFTRGGSHATKLPPNRRKVTIRHAATAMNEMGHRLGKASHDLRSGVTSYDVTHKDGTTHKLTAQQISDILYKTAVTDYGTTQLRIKMARMVTEAIEKYRFKFAVREAVERYMRAERVERYAEGRWITMGGKPGDSGDHEGGQPVFISEDGIILKGGPKALHGTNIKDAKEGFAAMRKPKAETEKSPEQPPKAAEAPAAPAQPQAPAKPPRMTKAEAFAIKNAIKAEGVDAVVEVRDGYTDNADGTTQWFEIYSVIARIRDPLTGNGETREFKDLASVKSTVAEMRAGLKKNAAKTRAAIRGERRFS